MRLAGRLEFIRRVMRERTRRKKKRSTNYCVSLRELAQQTMRVELDFVALWRLRVRAISLEALKEPWTEKFPINHAAIGGLATTRFSFPKDSSKRSVNYPPR